MIHVNFLLNLLKIMFSFIWESVHMYAYMHMPNIPEYWIELLKKEKRQKI